MLGADRVFTLGADGRVFIAKTRRTNHALLRMFITSVASALRALFGADGAYRAGASAAYFRF